MAEPSVMSPTGFWYRFYHVNLCSGAHDQQEEVWKMHFLIWPLETASKRESIPTDFYGKPPTFSYMCMLIFEFTSSFSDCKEEVCVGALCNFPWLKNSSKTQTETEACTSWWICGISSCGTVSSAPPSLPLTRWRKPLARTHTCRLTQTCYSCCSWHTVSTVFALRTAAARHGTAPRPRLFCLRVSKDLLLSQLIEYDNLGVTIVYLAALFLYCRTVNFKKFDRRMWKHLMSFIRWIKSSFFCLQECCFDRKQVFKDKCREQLDLIKTKD